MKAKLASQKVERDLSKLVNLGAVQKPTNDARDFPTILPELAAGAEVSSYKPLDPERADATALLRVTRSPGLHLGSGVGRDAIATGIGRISEGSTKLRNILCFRYALTGV
jgi:hypothetical protein